MIVSAISDPMFWFGLTLSRPTFGLDVVEICTNPWMPAPVFSCEPIQTEANTVASAAIC